MSSTQIRLLLRIADPTVECCTIADPDKAAITELLEERKVLLAACVSTLTLLDWIGRPEAHPAVCGCALCAQLKTLREAIAFADGSV